MLKQLRLILCVENILANSCTVSALCGTLVVAHTTTMKAFVQLLWAQRKKLLYSRSGRKVYSLTLKSWFNACMA